MLKPANLFARPCAAIVLAMLAATQIPSVTVAQGYDSDPGAARAAAAQARAQAAQARAAQAQMMRMKRAQAQAAEAAMSDTMAAAAAMATNDAGECAPYFAKWMMTRSPAAKARYEACMED